jgi:hypothetical protein
MAISWDLVRFRVTGPSAPLLVVGGSVIFVEYVRLFYECHRISTWR